MRFPPTASDGLILPPWCAQAVGGALACVAFHCRVVICLVVFPRTASAMKMKMVRAMTF
jgi:hypothetical protein